VQRATLLAVPREAPALPEGMAWVGRDGLAGADAAGGQAGDAALAARVVEALERGPGRDGGQPWAARGWFAEAERWLRATMERLGRPVTGTVRQARVWRLSCVLRAPTGDGDVWFKANTTSPLFVNEGVVMGTLAELFPGRVPAPLAVDPERGWMVLADFGEEVGWEVPLEVVAEVARTYARMQVKATGHVGRLLDAGCRDRRLDRLAAQARAWLAAVEATADLPGVDAATWLSPDEEAGLRAAVPRLQARCAELAGHAVPPSIVHGDLHLSNVARGRAATCSSTGPTPAWPTRSSTWRRSGGAPPSPTPRARTSCASGCARPTSPSGRRSSRPGRLARAWELAAPLGALHQAVGYRSLATQPPMDPHMAQSTAFWLRRVLALA
jgi:hypothetical protein